MSLSISRLMKQGLALPYHVYRHGLRRTFNHILCMMDEQAQRAACRAFPAQIIIEPHTFCNLSCITCATGQKRLNRPRGKMPWDMFRKLADEIAPRIEGVFWTGMCEPLLYEDNLRYIKYLTKSGLRVYVETNGHFFQNQHFTEQFIRTNVSSVNIAFDGLDQNSLRAFRGPNADYDRLISGIRLLLKTREMLHTKRPTVNLQFIVTRLNENLMDRVKTLKEELRVDTLTFKAVGADPSKQEQAALIPTSPELRRWEKDAQGVWRQKGDITNRCSRMYFCPMILWDGRVVPCCYDFSAEYAFGNAFETSFRQVWFSEAAINFRKQLVRNRSSIPMCTYCPEGRTIISRKQ